jgi:ribosomal protein S18 acetylase RimI-like enzyme
MNVFPIRRARPADIDAVAALLEKAAVWLAERGTDQWQGPAIRRREFVARDIAEETVHVVEADGQVAATITVDAFADADFWKQGDGVRSALYVHRMAVSRDLSGIGLGSAMLDFAGGLAVAAGKELLRLDAWRTNTALHDYYKGQGFELVRIEHFTHRGSGALFQRPAWVCQSSGPRLDPVTV